MLAFHLALALKLKLEFQQQHELGLGSLWNLKQYKQFQLLNKLLLKLADCNFLVFLSAPTLGNKGKNKNVILLYCS